MEYIQIPAETPGDSQFITLATDMVAPVVVTDTPESALFKRRHVYAIHVGLHPPEICLTLPSGEVVDFQMYDGAENLPNEVPHDEWAGIHAIVRLMLSSVDVKRAREDVAENSGVQRRQGCYRII